MKKLLSIFLFSICVVNFSNEIDNNKDVEILETIKPRCRVIVDNDFSGDPDGLFQLAHQMMSKSCEVKGIVGSHLSKGDPFDSSDVTAENAKKEVEKLLEIMNLKGKVPVYVGSNVSLENTEKYISSEATDFIINEALKEDKTPLYYVAGASLTEIANAYLKNPKIQDKLTLIWIGGQEHNGVAFPPPGYSNPEYNLKIDIKAGQVIFNKSNIKLWQLPRNAYRQTLMSYSEMLTRVNTKGELGKYLTKRILDVKNLADSVKVYTGETYIMGDNPLVLLSSLQSSFEMAPSSSKYIELKAPKINDTGLYENNSNGRIIRVYDELDVRLMFEDFYQKLEIYNK